jgi:hypothetical protein
MIDSYSFGKIKIQGQIFTKDLIILPDKIISPWWRSSGHKIVMEDLSEVFAYNFEILVIGTGFYGLVKVDLEVFDQLKKKEFSIITDRTNKAVELFNKNHFLKKTIGAFHLTC